MLKKIRQIEVFISCPSDVNKEKDIAKKVCDTLSNRIFSKKNTLIKTIDWEEDIPRIITGERPQKNIDKYLEEHAYDIYIGLLWKRFGEPQPNGLTPTEGEFEDALKRYEETGRPIIKFFFKKEIFYPNNQYETSQFFAVQKFEKRTKTLGLYDDFTNELDFQAKAYVGIHEIVDDLIFLKDIQIPFERIKYPEVIGYISRKVCPAEKYRPDELWILGDEIKNELANIIRQENRVVLIGDAGSGKTSELQRIANHFSAENSPFVPQLVRLNIISTQSIEEILQEGWDKIPENQLLVILDGLDEIEGKNKKDLIREIEFFSERYPASSIIVSTRTNFYRTEGGQSSGTLKGFVSYRLLNLDSEQIESYIQKMVSSKTDSFFREINLKGLSQFLAVPFYLIKLAEQFVRENALPNRKADIYARLLLARTELDEDHFRTTLELNEYRDKIVRNLERVAIGMELLGRNYISDSEFRDLVPDMESRSLLTHCTAWKKEEKENLTWQFEHNSIQEYLAARALSRQPLDVIKDFISFKPNYRRIIPSWVNTVSFLLSISEDSKLLDWILEIDSEICLKFENDKVGKNQRIKIFKDIFNRYKEKRIWIDRDRFRNDELARFGQSDEVINFLLREVESAEHHTALGNAIEILSSMRIPAALRDRTRELLEKVAIGNFNIEINESIQATALKALSNLDFDSRDIVERIVSELRNSKSDWVRYGLYYFLNHSDFLEEFIDVYLGGISYVRMDLRSEGVSRLGNERWELKEGLKKVKSPYAVIEILKYFIENESDLHNLLVGSHNISFIAEVASNAYFEDPCVLEHAVNFSLMMLGNYHKEEFSQFLKFYEKTNTNFDAFKIVFGSGHQQKDDFFASLADGQCLSFFVEQYENKVISDNEMLIFIQTLRWKDKELFEPFCLEINQKFGNKFLLKPVPDWEKQRKERSDRDFKLVFDKNELFKEIKLIFDTEQKEVLTSKELSKLRSEYWDNPYYSNLAYETLCKIAGDQTATMEIVSKTINTRDWELFCITKVYENLRNNEGLTLSQEQKRYVAEWCYSNLEKVEFRTAIKKEHEKSYSIRWNAIYIWYFFQRLDLTYPKHVLLDMISFDHNSTGIEYLETHLNETDMTSRILNNLNEGVIIDDVLKNHIEYCKKHKVEEVIKYALKEVVNSKRDHDEIRRISLEVICDLSEDLHELVEILPEVKDDFKWQVVDELAERNIEQVLGFIEKFYNKSEGEEKLKASEYLIKYQDLTALRFYVDWIKLQKYFSSSMYNSATLPSLRTSEAIPLLMELLELSYEKDFEQPEMFESLDRLVLDSLTMIAFESEENYLIIRRTIEGFIEKYSSIYANVNWLYAFLDQLEQKYYINKSEQLNIQDVICKLKIIDI